MNWALAPATFRAAGDLFFDLFCAPQPLSSKFKCKLFQMRLPCSLPESRCPSLAARSFPPIYNFKTGTPPTMTASMTEFATADQGFSLISNRKLLTLYAAMVTCRRMAKESRPSAKSKRGPAGAESILGHEAGFVGAAIDLLAGDTIAPTLWPEAVLQAINPSPVAATTVSIAARAALANGDRSRITLLFSSRKRAEQPPWLKALALAAEHRLPILFLTLSPGFLTPSPVQPTENFPTPNLPTPNAIPMKKKGYAFPSINVDGNDVVAVYRVASEAITHARKGHGPTHIHCMTPESANPLQNNPLQRDPLQNMRRYLIGKGLDPGWIDPGEFAS
jgi:TPP-dependent pyruvate/acetoin dehydrogenase alpha subunit